MSNIQQNAMPEAALTLPGMLADVAGRFAERAAIVENGNSISYQQLQQFSRQVARALMTLGVQAGDRVALWAPNLSEWIVAACGVHAAGAVLVPLNTRMKGAEAADILERSRAKVLVSVGDFLNNYYPDLLSGQRPATLEHLVVLGDKVLPSADLSWAQFMAKADATDAQAQLQREARIKPDDTADLMFTSGTTGRPKGVMCAHRPTILAFKAWSDVVGLSEGSRYLIVNPFFHTFGYKAGWVAALLQGATVYPEQVFDAEAILRRIESDRISFMPGPPTLFLSMLAHPGLKNFDLSSLESSVTGASTVPPILIKRMREELGIRNVTTAYGLTECGGCATLCEPTDSVETVANTCGKALPGTEVRCVDGQGRTVMAGEAGEVLLRGYHIMQGYFEDEQATAETIDVDGWLHTGDVGVLDERGYLRITDRLKDMFIVGGFNCYPAEIERLLSNHPEVAQVAVIGVADERMGEVGCACVVVRNGMTLDKDAFIAWCRANMANYKVPRFVLQLDSLPVNASNKVQKRDLIQIVKDRLEPAVQAA
ncbi:FadD3 family acyl-CoA ligase [Comamonas resistens]|uniref:FadD3 family acyl-CoA ligase n=1 Tax=Comamonas resistens TaxID=3046670 RepID=A0ABY8SXB1_9BURK|nr:FadD3 family acyl-CoA ligase [Comamonas resistens]MDL5038094.1 FadD3 family acyl-CoA ligase [Comamonas resistens]WHS66881.1 FadD3 family acyl-CoA ligase [Comamonas resistens]